MSNDHGHSAEKGLPRATVAEALAAWEAKGPTSLTVALLADALYGVEAAARDVLVDNANLCDAPGVCACSAARLHRALTTVIPPAGGDA